MLNDNEKSVLLGNECPLEKQDYAAASVFFRLAEKQFAGNDDFCILQGTTDLLLTVKKEIAAEKAK